MQPKDNHQQQALSQGVQQQQPVGVVGQLVTPSSSSSSLLQLLKWGLLLQKQLALMGRVHSSSQSSQRWKGRAYRSTKQGQVSSSSRMHSSSSSSSQARSWWLLRFL
jgi:hypothetical protein